MTSFDENGKYIKTNWKNGDRITADKLNKIEESIEAVNDNDISRHVETDTRLDALETKVETDLEGVNSQLEYNTNKLYGYNNVLNFKCDDGEYVKGDGKHDDTTGIQKALDNFIQNSNEVYIPSGNYKITKPLTLKRDNIIIRGSSKSTLQKHFNGNLLEPHTQLISRITLENLIIDGMNNEGHGFYSEREPGSSSTGYTSLVLNNVSMINNVGDGLHLKDSYCVNITDGDYNYNGENGIYLAGCHGTTLTHVNLFGNKVGLFITGGSFSVSVLSCIIQNCKSEGLKIGPSYGVTIINPYMENNGIQNRTASISCILDDGDRPTSVSIINPYISGNKTITPCAINLASSRYVEIHNPRLSLFVNEGINVGDDSWVTSIYGINSGIDCPKYITDKGSRTAQYGLVGVGLSSHRPSSKYLIPGTSFYDKSLSKPIWFDGTTWRDSQGASV